MIASPLRSSVPTHTSAGELNPDELERIVTIMQNPGQFKIPNWFVNRQKDIVDGKYGHLLSNQLDSKVRCSLLLWGAFEACCGRRAKPSRRGGSRRGRAGS